MMESALQEFLSSLETERGRSPNTLLAYRADLRQFLQVLVESTNKAVASSELTAEALHEYVVWLQSQGYRPATVSRKVAAVRSFLEHVRRNQGGVTAAAMEGLKSPPTPRRRPRVLSRAEVQALIQAPGRVSTPRGMRDAAILALLYSTGLRASDVVELKLEDVNREWADIRCPWDPGRRLALGAAAEPVLKYLDQARAHLARDNEVRAMFLNQRGEKLSRQGLWLVVKRWAREVGLGDDLSPHSLRHTLAHDLLVEGKSRREVQHRLGLRSPSAVRVSREGREREEP
jgi:integrase/recombinase XerD